MHNDLVYVGRNNRPYRPPEADPGTVFVFTKAGAPLRTIEICAGVPRGLLIHKERLYVTDFTQRVHVWSTTAPHTALQICHVPTSKTHFGLCIFNNRLLVSDRAVPGKLIAFEGL